MSYRHTTGDRWVTQRQKKHPFKAHIPQDFFVATTQEIRPVRGDSEAQILSEATGPSFNEPWRVDHATPLKQKPLQSSRDSITMHHMPISSCGAASFLNSRWSIMPIIVQWNFQSDKKYASRTWFGHLASFRRRGAMAKITAKQPWMMLKYTGSSIVLGPNQPLYFCATEETTIRHRSMTASSASQVQFQHIFSSVFIFLSCTAADPEVKVFISPCILPLFLHLLQRLETFTLRLHPNYITSTSSQSHLQPRLQSFALRLPSHERTIQQD